MGLETGAVIGRDADTKLMATRLAETLLGHNADTTRIHRRVVRVGAAAAWLSAAIFLVSGFIGGNDAMFIEAVGPILAAGFMTAQIVLRRENGGIALLGSAVVVTVMYAVVGSTETLVPASLALVVISSIAMLLIERNHLKIIGFVGTTLLLVPLMWGVPLGQGIQLGVVMSLSFAMTSAIFFTIRNAATTLNVRFQMLFEGSPTAVMEEDWSESIEYIRSEYTGRDDRLRAFLLAYPAITRKAVSLARIVRVNQAASDLLEADDPQDLIGYRDADKVTDDTLEAFAGALVALIEGHESFDQDVQTLTFKGRPIWLQIRAVDTTVDGHGKTILVGLADVTHIKARQEAMADLVRAKDEFIAKVSHELRTPLTAVIGLTSEMAAMEPMTSDERAELMELVASQAAEMSFIVEDLLVASRAEMGAVTINLAVVDLKHSLQTAIDGLGVILTEIPETIPEAIADPGRVRQVMRNLLTNAIRYGGPEIRVMTGALFDKVWVEFRDNGAGVPSDAVSRIFEPYGTAHSGVSGSVGLGLSVSRQLAELMGGTLTYYRDVDESVFRLELPLAGQKQAVLASHSLAV